MVYHWHIADVLRTRSIVKRANILVRVDVKRREARNEESEGVAPKCLPEYGCKFGLSVRHIGVGLFLGAFSQGSDNLPQSEQTLVDLDRFS